MAKLRVGAALAALAAVAWTGGAAASSSPARFLVGIAENSYAVELSEIVAADGRVIRVVAHNSSAVASPNRRLIAWDGVGGIHVENADGSRSRLLVKVHCRSKGPPGVAVDGCGGPFAWSSDSRHLLVEESSAGLAAVSVATGATHQVVPPRKHVSYSPVGWSVAANAILFTLDDAGGANGIGCCREELVVARPSGAGPRVLYSAREPIHDGASASWSPSGKWIAFTTDGRDRRDPRLAVVDEATGKSKAVRGYQGYTAPPTWSPDSSRFAAGSYQGPIGIYAAAGRKLGTLPPTQAVPLFWTQGAIYFEAGTEQPGKLLLIPAGGTSARSVFTLPQGQVLLSAEPF